MQGYTWCPLLLLYWFSEGDFPVAHCICAFPTLHIYTAPKARTVGWVATIKLVCSPFHLCTYRGTCPHWVGCLSHSPPTFSEDNLSCTLPKRWKTPVFSLPKNRETIVHLSKSDYYYRFLTELLFQLRMLSQLYLP